MARVDNRRDTDAVGAAVVQSEAGHHTTTRLPANMAYRRPVQDAVTRRGTGSHPPVRLGIIGLGAIGNLQLQVLRASHQDRVQVVAAADHARGGEDPGLPVYSDYRKLLQRDDVTAVAVNTPPSSHYSITVEALRAGKDVFVEKPPALLVEQAEHMIALASELGLCLFMAFHARYNAPVALARRALAGEKVLSADIVYRERVHDYHDPGGWVFDPAVSGGGALMDSGINALSVLASLTPQLRDYTLHEVRLGRAAGYTVETNADVAFAFGDGAVGRLCLDWLHAGPETRRVEIATFKHRYAIDIVHGRLERDGVLVAGPSRRSRRKVDQHAEYQAAYRDFAAHVARRISSTSTTELAFVRDSYAAAGVASRDVACGQA